MDPKKRSFDKAAQQMLKHMSDAAIENAWDRFEQQQPQCGFGKLGICCRNCSMGPCRIDPFDQGPQAGVCGATADTIATRNLVRMIAGGAAAHSDHGRDIAHTFKMAVESDTCLERSQQGMVLKWKAEKPKISPVTLLMWYWLNSESRMEH